MARKARPVKHIGFEAAAEKAAKGAGVSEERGRAIIAAGARKAGAKAKKRNPRLLKVRGARKGGPGGTRRMHA